MKKGGKEGSSSVELIRPRHATTAMKQKSGHGRIPKRIKIGGKERSGRKISIPSFGGTIKSARLQHVRR